MGKQPDMVTCRCRALARRLYEANIYTFKPYVEQHLDVNPIEITSRQQRDALLAEKKATYDTGRYVRRPKYKPAIDSITFDDVMRDLKEHGPRLSEQIREPVGEIPTRDLGAPSG